jgi:adenine-specific DNA-methyltransferase
MKVTSARRTISDDPESLRIENVRLHATAALDQGKRSEFGQFMTPWPVARFMASLFSMGGDSTTLLDAGAGVGSITIGVG